MQKNAFNLIAHSDKCSFFLLRLVVHDSIGTTWHIMGATLPHTVRLNKLQLFCLSQCCSLVSPYVR